MSEEKIETKRIEPIEITIPEKIPTVNTLYYHRGNTKVLRNEARALRERIKGYVHKAVMGKIDSREYLVGKPLYVQIIVHENWYTKKGQVKKRDIANREKFIIDSVFKELLIDDKYIFFNQLMKVQSTTEEKTEVKICVLEQ